MRHLQYSENIFRNHVAAVFSQKNKTDGGTKTIDRKKPDIHTGTTVISVDESVQRGWHLFFSCAVETSKLIVARSALSLIESHVAARDLKLMHDPRFVADLRDEDVRGAN